ncbi:MAG: ABC transporter permease [Gemmatimonadetes bacterium]|nr:ABC transporter permease [Gemmatimonadota bacterium]
MADFKRAFRLDRASRSDVRSAVDDELQHHLESEVEELTDAGWGESEAWAEARRRFGDIDETRTYCARMQTERGRRERRREMMSMDELRQNLKYAFRAIRRAPGYAGLVVLTLAFGIAANTTIFSVMNPYLFRPLPFGEADELVQVNQVDPVLGFDMARFSFPQFVDWRARTRAFDDLAAYNYGSINVTGVEAPEQMTFGRLTENMFDVLDVRPAMGRTFLPGDGAPDAEPVVVLDHGLWERRYQGDPSLIGRPITLDGVQHTVVGVMPPDFNFPYGEVKIWVPLQASATDNRDREAYLLVGRLADGWTIERARGELTGIQAELSRQYPDVDGKMDGVTIKPIREALNFAWDIVNVLFLVLLAAVGFVLLIACANVASLTLARGSGRVREVSVRSAMGAARGRIVRQLVTESTVLALLGGALGIGLAYLLTSLVNPVIPEGLFKIGGVTIDGMVLAFSLAVTLVTPVVFGLLPAMSASKTDLVTGLKEGAKGSNGLGTSRGRQVLVVAQVALAVVLLTGAGLTLRSFASVQALDLGFDPDRVVTVEVNLTAQEYPSGEERRAFLTQTVESVGRLPGVEAASTVQWLPQNHETVAVQTVPSHMVGTPVDEWPLATFNRVHPDYFDAMSIELVAGRDFTTLDGIDAEPVAVVNRLFADRFWPSGSALGQTVLVGDRADPATLTIVGVVEDIFHADLNPAEVRPQIYRSAAQGAASRFFVVARSQGDPSELAPGIRTALSELAPSMPTVIRPMNDVVAENDIPWRVASVFLMLFGAGAILLATLGIYGLISYSVAQREKEMAVRIAMGASAADIRKRVVGDGLKLTGIGLVVGLAAAVGLGQVASAVLFGVSPNDPVTLVSVLGLFLGVAALASFVPAARASRTSPIEVLRAE